MGWHRPATGCFTSRWRRRPARRRRAARDPRRAVRHERRGFRSGACSSPMSRARRFFGAASRTRICSDSTRRHAASCARRRSTTSSTSTIFVQRRLLRRRSAGARLSELRARDRRVAAEARRILGGRQADCSRGSAARRSSGSCRRRRCRLDAVLRRPARPIRHVADDGGPSSGAGADPADHRKPRAKPVYSGDTPLPANTTFDAAANSLRFEFALPTYLDESATEYQSRLDGFDSDWSAWTREGQRDYTNLGFGDYRFRVRARSVSGAVSDEAVYAFTILPPWYRTWLGVRLLRHARRAGPQRCHAPDARCA